MLTEAFMRIRLTAREKEIEADMQSKILRAAWISKLCNLWNAVSQWRSLVLEQVRLNREQAQTTLIQTTLKNKNDLEHLTKLKQERAIRVMNQRSLGRLFDQWFIETWKLKTMRVQGETLKKNSNYIKLKYAVEKIRTWVEITKKCRWNVEELQ